MKFNLIPSIITLVFVGLIVFGFYSWCRCEDLKLLLTIFSSISLLLSMSAILGISVENTKKSINIKVLSAIFTLVLLVSNVIFCCFSYFSAPIYIIINGILLLIWLLCCYGIIKSNI